MEPRFRQICILAPGLLGASLATGVRQRALADRIHVWARRAEIREKCAEKEWCDAVFDTPEGAVEGSDLVVICTPVETIHRLARRIAGSLPKGGIITDVGSTKSQVCRLSDAIMPSGCFFVGSHPMAGSEKSGMDYARGDLFEKRTCFVTPLETTDSVALEKIASFWSAMGMETVTILPEEHDRIVANISHLPHYAATIICNWLAENNPEWKKWAGGGLCDTTRVAAGSPHMWRAISEQNKVEILRSLDAFQQEMLKMREALANDRFDELTSMFESGKKYRESLEACKNGHSA